MNSGMRFLKRLEQFARRYGITLAFTIIANVAALLGIFSYFGLTPENSKLWIVVSAIFVAAGFTWTYVASYRAYSENKKLNAKLGELQQSIEKLHQKIGHCTHELHQINHHYRDILCEMFSQIESHGEFNDADLLKKEKEVLGEICHKISNIFRELIDSKCMVSVSLIEDEEGEKVSFTWARSELDIDRNQRPVKKFKINAENTRYFLALQRRPAGPSFFHGADLPTMAKEGKYYDRTPDWELLYKSCIVVPIRHCKTGSTASDDLGFLRVDTIEINRLNPDSHVQFLAAFADQMYNFMSLMRGRYSLKKLKATPATVESVSTAKN
jgi:hypothetical protein